MVVNGYSSADEISADKKAYANEPTNHLSNNIFCKGFNVLPELGHSFPPARCAVMISRRVRPLASPSRGTTNQKHCRLAQNFPQTAMKKGKGAKIVLPRVE